MSEKNLCGAHTEIAKSEGVKISRCTCGTLHVNLARSGVTVQLSPENFEELAHVIALASRATQGTRAPIDTPTSSGEKQSVLPPQGHFISVKKPTLN